MRIRDPQTGRFVATPPEEKLLAEIEDAINLVRALTTAFRARPRLNAELHNARRVANRVLRRIEKLDIGNRVDS
jgi:hypothetical protein